MKKLWMVIKYKGTIEQDTIFDVQGIFDCEERAKFACTHPSFGYGPLNLNEELNEETETWPGFIYPDADGCRSSNECNLKKSVCNGETCPWRS